MKIVLNVGCGSATGRGIHEYFKNDQWQELRLDADPRVKPDIVAKASDMRGHIEDASVDAVWCSHVFEHLLHSEALEALKEIHRALKADGFAIITSPDLAVIAESILLNKLHDTVYNSPAGPITAHDMLYGHQKSVSKGNTYMQHRTGFTAVSLGELLLEAGFGEARVIRRSPDIWALAFRGEARTDVINDLASLGLIPAALKTDAHALRCA